ncbi:16S rRNA (uracil(1498)-N(3))-methyltransferase [uncultured Ilyobacter sp.]|uniref:RsmE family RNA methyltransferase n=1 Tax=uncultured Ilyobacter sp. TaxID=544433 RepID=UPI002AA72121|nr:16S rRNA (uracil(1498)-N(3))-methyltransferase [uncultured Ilyobacter sp.]
MISVFVEKENISENIVKITEKSDVNHLKNVFRMKEGDKLRVVDGEYEYFCTVVILEKKEITAEINEKKSDEYSSAIKIDAALGILKNDKMDLVIQKLTEIGINKIIPTITKRTIVKLKEKKSKWDTVSKEALKQCQGVRLMEISEPRKLSEIEFSDYDLVLLPYECAENTRIKDVLNKSEKTPEKILYLIGSEGGFSEEEVAYLQENNAKVVTLGKRILRAETAAIVVGGVLINDLE